MATGLSISSTSNMSTGQKIFVAKAIMANEPSAPNAELIMSERIPPGHKQWDVLSWSRLADAAALTEGDDLTVSQQIVTTALSITPAENGLLARVSWRLARRQGDASVFGTTGMMVGNSLARLKDKDVITLYDGASKSTPGAGAALTATHFRGAYAYIRTDDDDGAFGPGELPLMASLHIEQISDVVLDLATGAGTAAFPTGFSQELLQQWWVGRHRLYSIQVFEGGNIPRDSSDDAKGSIHSRDAYYMVVANESDFTKQEDPSQRSTELGAFQEWGTGERADPHAVEIYSDAAATI
jgi:hypothetical protein